MHGSMVRTPGFTPEAFAVENNTDYGYVGTSDFPPGNSANPPLDYFGDFQDEPQKKFHVQ